MRVENESSSGAYASILRYFLSSDGGWHRCKPRGLACREVLNAWTAVHRPSDEPIATADEERNAKIRRYTNAEFDLYERGANDVREFAKHAPFWMPLANKDGTINSSYGKIVWKDRTHDQGTKTPWEWARESILADADTRQALVQFVQPRHFVWGTKDLVCTCHGWFAARQGKLDLTVVMRSNDVVRGFVYDVPWFCHLLLKMAREVGLEVGRYEHLAHSLHLYESDVEVAGRMFHGPVR